MPTPRPIRSERIDTSRPAAVVIAERFDGLSHFCRLMNYPTSTAQSWLEKGYIPPIRGGVRYHADIVRVAKENGIEVRMSDFVDAE